MLAAVPHRANHKCGSANRGPLAGVRMPTQTSGVSETRSFRVSSIAQLSTCARFCPRNGSLVSRGGTAVASPPSLSGRLAGAAAHSRAHARAFKAGHPSLSNASARGYESGSRPRRLPCGRGSGAWVKPRGLRGCRDGMSRSKPRGSQTGASVHGLLISGNSGFRGSWVRLRGLNRGFSGSFACGSGAAGAPVRLVRVELRFVG